MTSPCPCGNLDEPYYKWVDTSNGENGYYFIVEALYPEQHLKSIPEPKAVPVAQKIPVPPVIPTTTVAPMTTVVPTTTVASTTKAPPAPPPMPSPLIAPDLSSPSTTKAPPAPPPMPSPLIAPDLSSPSTNYLTYTLAQLQMEKSALPPSTTNFTGLGLGEALAKFKQYGGKLRSHSKSATIMGRNKPVGSSSESSKGSNIGSHKSIGEKPALLPKPSLQQVLLSRSHALHKSSDEEEGSGWSDWDE